MVNMFPLQNKNEFQFPSVAVQDFENTDDVKNEKYPIFWDTPQH